MRGLALLLLLIPAAAAERETEAELLRRWADASPEERRRLTVRLDELEKARRFSSARPVLIDFDEQTLTLAQLFADVLEPALLTPARPQSASDPGLVEIHLRALKALDTLRGVYAPPRPVRTGTLNLFLSYAHRALTARELPPALRLRFFTEAIRSVRQLDGRVEPDARTTWILRHRLLPALLALARRTNDDPAVRETVSEAASLLYLPSILDERAQVQLAPLTSGVHSRTVLVRFYRDGLLDELGLVALARSVAAQASDDAAFAAGAAPLVLELLGDARLPARERGALLDVVLEKFAAVEILRPAVRDLLAAGFGGPPRELAAYRALRKGSGSGVGLPRGERVFRFLSVVLVQGKTDAPPSVARVVRNDLRHHDPLWAVDARGRRRFLGILVPDAGGKHADFVGPPPRLTGTRDHRLLRRRLELERISIRTFGAKGEEIELCVTLPEDESEPIPARGANLSHVLALIDARLGRTADSAERRELVRLLVRIDTDASRALAARHGAETGVARELLPLAERGHVPAARLLLTRLGDLALVDRERALAAALAIKQAELVRAVRALCASDDVATAALAGDALLASGDAHGVPALLAHSNKYVRGCGVALALRLTKLAGTVRIIPEERPDMKRIAELAGHAFTKEDGEVWMRFGAWLRKFAFQDLDAVRKARSAQKLKIGQRRVFPYEYAAFWTRALNDGKFDEHWGPFTAHLLSPHHPGRGISETNLESLLDALEARAPAFEETWRDALVVLCCAQYGMEIDVQFLDVAHRRLHKLAGDTAPPEARRKAGVYWPIWAAGEANR